jgi:hypothetical protein
VNVQRPDVARDYDACAGAVIDHQNTSVQPRSGGIPFFYLAVIARRT